ncbi:regulatory protein MokC for HokC [Escherichia coli]|nr:regulatory protein MokC for HokC [Escherichia coli]
MLDTCRLASYVPKGKEKQAIVLTPSCNVPFEPF